MDIFRVICLIGAGLATCAIFYSPNFYGEPAYLYGINIGVIGVFGYSFLLFFSIVAEHYRSFRLYVSFVVSTFLLLPVTVFLALRAYDAGKVCPICLSCWVVNILLVTILSVYIFLKWRTIKNFKVNLGWR